jgi:hypothetical protein
MIICFTTCFIAAKWADVSRWKLTDAKWKQGVHSTEYGWYWITNWRVINGYNSTTSGLADSSLLYFILH